MLTRFFRKQLDAFERKWTYDTSYMREVLDQAGAGALMPMQHVQKIAAYRKDVPDEVYFAATIEAVRLADCGPCMQLGVRMAETAGVPAPVLRAVVAGDRDAMSPDVRLAFDLAHATMARDALACARLSEEAKRRWGMRGLVSLAYGMVAAQSYPTFKYAIGHGIACSQIAVGGAMVTAHERTPRELHPVR